MGQWCMVMLCNNSNKNSAVSFFNLTKKRYHSWMIAVGRDPHIEALTHGNVICEEHFIAEDFIQSGDKKMLKPNAVPRLKLGPRKPSMQTSTPGCSLSNSKSGRDDFTAGMELAESSISKDQNIDEARSSSSLTDDSPLPESVFDPNNLMQDKRKLSNGISSSDSEGLTGTPKRIKQDHTYSMCPKKLAKSLEEVKVSNRKLHLKLNSMKKLVKRLRKKVTHLKDIVKHVKHKRLVSDAAGNMLEKTYSGIPLAIMKRHVANAQKSARGKKQGREKFPESLRSFALTLQFYSSKAYNYVRKVFSLALPAPSTIRSWLTNINCEPGFTESSFIALKKIVDVNKSKLLETICSLVIDEMAIKKQVDFINNKMWGYEDIGTGVRDDQLKCAREAFVLMVVSINGSWKVPICYYLIDSLTGSEKANIVKEALVKLHNFGVRVTSVTCDGPSANFTMATSLGAKVTNINRIKPYFKHPVDGSNIYILFDACHMIKLLRNNWATSEIFIDRQGRKIDFNLVKKLHQLQDREVFKFGNKLKRAHIEWQQQKMKVNLAVQTISNSIADALEFLMIDIQHPEFRNAEGTIQFLRIFDKAFDVCNSRSPIGKGSKAPLRERNEIYWRYILLETIEYTKTLKLQDGSLLHCSQKKTPFKGFCITILSILGIFEEYVRPQNSHLKYVLTYKFSQDHIELFFCSVRPKNGWNNNPTAYQFYHTYKRLALKHDITNLEGNCSSDDTTLLTTSSKNFKKISPAITIDDVALVKKYSLETTDISITDGNIEYELQCLPTLSLLAENAIV